eukprot:scaffold7649_cov165-Ochromonas_danica.AAC.5
MLVSLNAGWQHAGALKIEQNSPENNENGGEGTHCDYRKTVFDRLDGVDVVEVHAEETRDIGSKANATGQDCQRRVGNQQLVTRSIQPKTHQLLRTLDLTANKPHFEFQRVEVNEVGLDQLFDLIVRAEDLWHKWEAVEIGPALQEAEVHESHLLVVLCQCLQSIAGACDAIDHEGEVILQAPHLFLNSHGDERAKAEVSQGILWQTIVSLNHQNTSGTTARLKDHYLHCLVHAIELLHLQGLHRSDKCLVSVGFEGDSVPLLVVGSGTALIAVPLCQSQAVHEETDSADTILHTHRAYTGQGWI